MSERVMEKIDRFSQTVERLTGAMEKIPRVAEMMGVAYFASRAAALVGGNPVDGAIGGIVADGLAHSQLANNLVAGTALGVYLSTIGILNVAADPVKTFADDVTTQNEAYQEDFGGALDQAIMDLLNPPTMDQPVKPIRGPQR